MAGTTAKELLKALEERAKEIEALKKELQKCEKERKQLENQKHSFDDKQPANMQLLLAQKRELQMQLEREESEKHELFSQINQLIGDVDDLRNKQDSGDSSQAQLQELGLENDQLKKDFGRKEMAFQKVSEELLRLQSELERRERTYNLEKNRLAEEIQDCQKEIEVKSAALQSLSLAKTNNKDSATLLIRNNELRQELQEKEDLLRELTETNDELGQSLTECGAQIDALHTQIAQVSNSLKLQTQQLDSQKEDFDQQKQKMESEITLLLQKNEIAEHCSKELTFKLEEMEKEKKRLRQNVGMTEDWGILMDSLKAVKVELGAKEAEIIGLREHCLNLEVEMDGLMLELKKSKERSGEEYGKACEQCSLKKDEIRTLNLEQELIKQKMAKQQDLGVLIEKLEAEKKELTTHLQSKTNRLESVEELLVRLESSLKLIEAENAQVKVAELERLKQIQTLNQQLADLEKSFSISKDALSLNAAKEAEIIQELTKNLENERLIVVEKNQQLLELQNSEEKNQILLKRIMNALEVEHVGGIEEDQENLIVHKLISYKEQSRGLQQHLAELDNLKKSSTEAESMDKLITELREAEQKNEALAMEMDEVKVMHSEELKSIQDEMVENVGRLSGLLESETKRQSTTKQEKEHWQNEANKLAQQKTELEKKVEDLQEKLVQENLRAPLHRPNSNTSSSDRAIPEEESSLKNKVSRLMDENAQLAGDLLKQQTSTEKEFRKLLQQEKQSWLAEKSDLETKLKLTEQQLEKATATKQSKDSAEPVPKPRKTLNGGELDVLSADSASTCDSLPDVLAEVVKLRAELDKQKRLVTVLRKKLQQQNIEATLRSRVENSSVGTTNSGAATLPRRL